MEAGRDFEMQVDASPYPGQADYAIDHKVSTRWKTGRPQHPGDYFLVEFDRPVNIIKVALSTRGHPMDFPRGILVEGSKDGKEFMKIINKPRWLGPLGWTQDGYPFYGRQGAVILDFPEEIEVTVLRFTQTGRSTRFDWSIEELKLYGP